MRYVVCTRGFLDFTPQGKIVLASIFPLDSGTQNWNESWHGTRFFSFTCGIQNFGPKTVVLYQTVKLEFGSRFLLKFWLESWHGTRFFLSRAEFKIPNTLLGEALSPIK